MRSELFIHDFRCTPRAHLIIIERVRHPFIRCKISTPGAWGTEAVSFVATGVTGWFEAIPTDVDHPRFRPPSFRSQWRQKWGARWWVLFESMPAGLIRLGRLELMIVRCWRTRRNVTRFGFHADEQRLSGSKACVGRVSLGKKPSMGRGIPGFLLHSPIELPVLRSHWGGDGRQAKDGALLRCVPMCGRRARSLIILKKGVGVLTLTFAGEPSINCPCTTKGVVSVTTPRNKVARRRPI
jgi:hypothetical protein